MWDKSEESAPGEEDDEDEDRTEDDLPVDGPAREQILEEQQHHGADDRSREGAHAAHESVVLAEIPRRAALLARLIETL